jgi:dihydrodipicolinate synthase/N-acetylneuraminate lyase
VGAMLYVAAITPRDGHGEIEIGAIFELVDYLSSALGRGHGAIALFDAAGEYPMLNPGDRSRTLKLAVKRSRVPVLAGVGAATLDLSLQLAREARDAGAQALLAPPPYFYPYGPEEIREFYLQFGARMDGIDIYLEHLPEFTSGIDVETARALLATGRFTGIVDTTGEHSAAGLDTVMANDRLFACTRCSGRPALSAAACAAPELMLALDAAITASNTSEIERLNTRLQELLDWFDLFPPFALLRVATSLRKIKTGPLAVPLTAEKERRMGEFREWFRNWNQ